MTVVTVSLCPRYLLSVARYGISYRWKVRNESSKTSHEAK